MKKQINKKKLINKGKESGKQTHSNANTCVNERHSSFKKNKKKDRNPIYSVYVDDQLIHFQFYFFLSKFIIIENTFHAFLIHIKI